LGVQSTRVLFWMQLWRGLDVAAFAGVTLGACFRNDTDSYAMGIGAWSGDVFVQGSAFLPCNFPHPMVALFGEQHMKFRNKHAVENLGTCPCLPFIVVI
jgi:hypothetical protein